MKKIIVGLMLALMLIATFVAAKYVILKPKLQDMAEKHKDKEMIQMFATDDWVCNEPFGSIKYSVIGDKLYIDRLYARMLPEATTYTLKIGDFEIPFDVSGYESTFCRECADDRVPKCINVRYIKGKVDTKIDYEVKEGIYKDLEISVYADDIKILDGMYNANFVVLEFAEE